MIFDIKRFYDSIIFDLNQLLIVRVKNVNQILKISKTSFDDVLIKQNAHDDETKDFFIDDEDYTRDANESKNVIDLQIDSKTQTSIDFQIDLKDSVFINLMIISKMTSNKELIASKNVSHFLRNDLSFSKKSKKVILTKSHASSIDSFHAFLIDSSNANVVVSTKNVQIKLKSMNQNSTNQESMFKSISKSKRTRKNEFILS